MITILPCFTPFIPSTLEGLATIPVMTCFYAVLWIKVHGNARIIINIYLMDKFVKKSYKTDRPGL